MASLLETVDQALPVTRLARQLKLYLDKFCRRERDKYVVMRNNEPVAVLLSVVCFEAIAKDRLTSFDGKTTISHSDMLEEFED